ncbi:MAG: hypothetical protein JSU66_02670 [Deltaproteobacteria bacterium]|nr:MAG: hypothetical protein JSU66_02670 [Deltaproteobacteria bacterium]
MRLRSRGLGRKELVMDFREYEVVRQGDELVVVGTVRDPVNWDFTIRICEDDVPGLARLALRRSLLGMLLGSLFKRRRRHHWSQEHPEHIAEGRRRRAATRDNAAERARKSLEPLSRKSLRPARERARPGRELVRPARSPAQAVRPGDGARDAAASPPDEDPIEISSAAG